MTALGPSVQARGRAVYRDLLRAAALAFEGDARVLNGFRQKARTDFIKGRTITSETQYNAQLTHASEVASFLRKNIVQGYNDPSVPSDVYRLRWREGIELGDNDTIKNALRRKNAERAEKERERAKSKQSTAFDAIPPSSNDNPDDLFSEPAEPNSTPSDLFEFEPTSPSPSPSSSLPPRSAGYDLPAPTSDALSSNSQIPTTGDSTRPKALKNLSKKALYEARNKRAIPEIREEDLEESFVRGSGPGGQAINKTRSNVQLLHRPTGIQVTCQETRSLEANRRIARGMLRERLDQLLNPGLSKLDVQTVLERRRKKNRAKKAAGKKRRLAGAEAGGVDAVAEEAEAVGE